MNKVFKKAGRKQGQGRKELYKAIFKDRRHNFRVPELRKLPENRIRKLLNPKSIATGLITPKKSSHTENITG
jgi:hypothetical protein